MPLDLLMLAALIVCILLGFPVSFSISGTAIAFAFLGWATGALDLTLLGALGQRVYGVLTNTVLIAIPLFVMMGVVLEKSRIAEELLETMGRLFGGLRGGLGVSVVLVGALLAASTGIVGATVIAMGLIALPTMLRAGYDARLASGIVCTSGTLGQIIPPSTLLIILSDVMSNAYQQAQFEQGQFTVETISVGQIFAGALLPGLLLVAVYIVYVLARAFLVPGDAPPLTQGVARPSLPEIGRAIVPPIMLIVAVLGAILGGIATPTEAATIGVVGALVLAAAGGTLSWAGFLDGLMAATRMSCMIALIIAAAACLTIAVGFLDIPRALAGWVDRQGFSAYGLLAVLALCILVMGCFLEGISIIVLSASVMLPMVQAAGIDLLWFGIFVVVLIEAAQITPPVGFNLFVLQSLTGRDIWRVTAATLPFFLLLMLLLVTITLFPSIVTWLPERMIAR